MNYWPLSVMLWSPELSPRQKDELRAFSLSDDTMTACRNLACKTPASNGSLVVMCSEDASARRIYLRRPTQADWDALERGGFLAAHNGFYFMMDAIH